MRGPIPTNWIPCTKQEFDDFLKQVNWRRDNFSGCDTYLQVNSGELLAVHDLEKNRYLLPPLQNSQSIKETIEFLVQDFDKYSSGFPVSATIQRDESDILQYSRCFMVTGVSVAHCFNEAKNWICVHLICHPEQIKEIILHKP